MMRKTIRGTIRDAPCVCEFRQLTQRSGDRGVVGDGIGRPYPSLNGRPPLFPFPSLLLASFLPRSHCVGAVQDRTTTPAPVCGTMLSTDNGVPTRIVEICLIRGGGKWVGEIAHQRSGYPAHAESFARKCAANCCLHPRGRSRKSHSSQSVSILSTAASACLVL